MNCFLKLLRLFCLFLSMFGLVSVCWGQGTSFCFRHLKVEDGLAQSTVTHLIQDSKGFMWFGTLDGLSRYDGYRFRNFTYDPLKNVGQLGDGYIHYLCEDMQGNIWVGTLRGVYIYNPRTENFDHFTKTTEDGSRISGNITAIATDKTGNVWIADYGNGLFRYDTSKDTLICYRADGSPGSLSSNEITSILVDREDKVWIGTLGYTNGCLNVFCPADETFRHFSTRVGGVEIAINKVVEDNRDYLLLGSPNFGVYSFNKRTGVATPLIWNDSDHMFVTDILCVGTDEIWVGTSSGIYVYNRTNSRILHMRPNSADRNSLSSYMIYAMAQDKDGGIWIGTHAGGVNYLPGNHNNFEKFYPISTTDGMSGKIVRDMDEDSAGHIWIATEDKGLNRYDPQTDKFEQYTADNGKIESNSITAFSIYDHYLLIGYLGKGLDVIDMRSGSRINHMPNENDSLALKDNTVMSIYPDSRGRVWIGTTLNMQRYDPITRKFATIKALSGNSFIFDILEDYLGYIWVATYNKGLFRYDPLRGDCVHFTHDPATPGSIGFDRVICLFEDTRNRLWAGTEGGGVSVYCPTEGTFRVYTTGDGLPSNVVYKILEDDKNRLWLSTNRGLSCFDLERDQFINYSFSDGLVSDLFNYKSGLKASDGMLYFGGTEGFIRFDPYGILSQTTPSPVVFTGFQVFNQDVDIATSGSPLNESIVNNPQIILTHNQSTFNLEFAVLSYNTPRLNRYAYRMEGYDKNWIYTKDNRVTYSNMPPGHYRFHIRGANSSGVWNERGQTLEITVLSPPWLTWWAITVYVLVVLALAYWGSAVVKARKREKQERMIKDMKAQKERDIYESKIKFFTSVAHEIKNSFSLIKAPFEQLDKCQNDKTEYEQNMEVIGANIERLQNLTMQVFDFNKVENSSFRFSYVNANVNHLVESVLYCFMPTLHTRNIDLRMSMPHPEIESRLDSEAFIKIVSNLLNNAAKFAQKVICVELYADNDVFTLVVSNDGEIIDCKYRDLIFNTFFQIPGSRNNGEGIGMGLSLVKHLVTLHKGEVFLADSDGKMNRFVVKIPMLPPELPFESAYEENAPIDDVSSSGEVLSEKPGKSKLTILIVEDDKGMLDFLQKLLSKNYHILTANYASEAMVLLDKNPVDLILSDVMMPGMDGFDFCRWIKSQIEYSHIPVILLTAQSGIESKIAGMESGADAYIEKPFSAEFLQSQIANLFQNKMLLKQAFLKSPSMLTETIAGSAEDDKLLKKIVDIIEKHLDDVNFSVEQLANELCIGRSNLYRKIKRLADSTPNDFIRLIRLKKAAQMIREGNYRIVEIGYMTGFTSSSYFAKCFKKQFGMLPKEFANKSDIPVE